MKTFIVALAVGASLVACASVPMGSAQQDAILKEFTVAADKAGLFI